MLDVGEVRLRWIGHQIRAKCEVVVSPDITAGQAHQVTVSAEHDLLHAISRLAAALVHADRSLRAPTRTRFSPATSRPGRRADTIRQVPILA